METFTYFSVTKHTTLDELNDQMRELSKKLHPDTEPDEEKKAALQEKFQAMQNEYEKAMLFVGKKAGKSAIEITSMIYDQMEAIFPTFESDLKVFASGLAIKLLKKAKFISPTMKILMKPMIKKGIQGFDAKNFIEELKKDKKNN